MHRFTWDLRYTTPQALHVQTPYNYSTAAIVGETPLPPLGPLVLPGSYEVRLTVDGHTYRQPFEVQMDPRVSFQRDQLQSTLDLQRKISTALEKNFAAIEQVKSLQAQLAEIIKRPDTDSIAKTGKELNAKVGAMQGEAAFSALDTPTRGSLLTINDSLISLMTLADGADFAPSAGSITSFENVCKALNATLAEWQSLKSKDVAEFSKTIAGQAVRIPDYAPIAGDPGCGEATTTEAK
jgi:hypothetical protein